MWTIEVALGTDDEDSAALAFDDIVDLTHQRFPLATFTLRRTPDASTGLDRAPSTSGDS